MPPFKVPKKLKVDMPKLHADVVKTEPKDTMTENGKYYYSSSLFT